MSGLVGRAVQVLAFTAATAVLVFAMVSLAGGGRGAQTVASAAAGGVQVCPATGCTATSCHATDPSAPGPGSGAGIRSEQEQQNEGSVPGSGNESVGGSGGVLVCPATGCTATNCHATAGFGGGSRGGGRQWRGWGSSDD